VQEDAVEHGAWIEAGDTHFMVYVEGATPPPRLWLKGKESEREDARLDAAHTALIRLRREAQSEPLYAIVDGARDRRILQLIREHIEPHQSLFDGLKGESLEDVAPYIVGPMQEGSALLEKLVWEGWGKRWGIWCSSADRFAEVRRHWRRYLMVDLEESGERVYFRFYDPGVLRVFWPTCTRAQRTELAAGMASILVEGKDLSVVSLPPRIFGDEDG